MSVRINVDPTNPGQYFACCGLLELADRLSPGAEAWFEQSAFCISTGLPLSDVLEAARSVKFQERERLEDKDDNDEDDGDDDSSAQLLLVLAPVVLHLDWWHDKSLKTWAGSMDVRRIAAAMSYAIDAKQADSLNQGQVVYDPPMPATGVATRTKQAAPKKREPFCFDSRRGGNSHSIDIGFSPNDLKLTTIAFPAVEFLCLVGLQRCRPARASHPRVFTYWTWSWPCRPLLLPAAANGLIDDPRAVSYRFENGFRSGQKKHKAYRSAIPLSLGDRI